MSTMHLHSDPCERQRHPQHAEPLRIHRELRDQVLVMLFLLLAILLRSA